LYHEATIVNLLQVVMYHPGSCKEAGEAILDLIHYSFNQFQFALSWSHPNLQQRSDAQSLVNKSEEESFEESIKEMEFSIAMNCLGLFRSISDQINDLPLSALNLLLVDKDMIVTLVQMIEKAPWIRKQKDLEKFENGTWHRISVEDLEIVTKLEAQVWLALMNLTLENECKKKYQYSKQNQAIVLRLKEYISQRTVDQLPPLVDLQRYLEELLMMAPPDYIQVMSSIQPISEIESQIWENVDIEKVRSSHRKALLSFNERHKKEMAIR
jgi:hypothetical protein